MIIFAGLDYDSTLDDLWIMDTKTYFWKEIKVEGDRPKDRRSHGCCVVGKKMYIFGGG
jgi:hypothetical protein